MTDEKEFELFVDSIKRNGLFVPIVISKEGTVIDGQKRVAAFKLLNINKIPCVTFDIDEGDIDRVRFLLRLHTNVYAKEEITELYQYLLTRYSMHDDPAMLNDHLSIDAAFFKKYAKKKEMKIKVAKDIVFSLQPTNVKIEITIKRNSIKKNSSMLKLLTDLLDKNEKQMKLLKKFIVNANG